ncbi:MAG: hypothetical protein KAY29_02695 [Brevundimonas sp.]|nr:hypothetical protein [Brevundimonas sp.]MBP8072554.1 hypothetical protein [Brevundimonas sp.]
MKPTLLAALCAILCAGPTLALAQDEDDWEFQHEASLNQTVAAVRYDAGVAIVVQCRDNALSAALVGMPAGVGGIEVQARRADGRTDLQTWVPGPQPGIMLSTVPARDIRFMRGGGLYSVRTVDGAPRALRTNFDLPTQSANLDRVLSACGWPLSDDRDQLTRADKDVSFGDPNARPRERPRGRGARPGRPDAPPPTAPTPPVLPPAERQFSCVLRDLKLTGCRYDHPSAAAALPAGARFLRQLEGREMYAPDGAITEGEVFYWGTAGRDGPYIQVTREQLL